MSNSTATSLMDFESVDLSTKDIIRKLKIELMTLRRMGIEKVKILHGLGSSTDGDNISNLIRAELLEQARLEKINAFCPGEVFGPFEKEGKHIIEVEPSFRDDEDWTKTNSNITVVAI